MIAPALPAASAATAATSPSLPAHAAHPTSTPLTRVSLAFLERRFKLYLRFGEPARTQRLDRWRSLAVFMPNAVFCRIRWQANDYGTGLAPLSRTGIGLIFKPGLAAAQAGVQGYPPAAWRLPRKRRRWVTRV